MRRQVGIRVKLILVVIPVVLVIIFSFFALSRRMLIRQAEEKLVGRRHLKGNHCVCGYD